MIDLNKAEALLRAEGLDPVRASLAVDLVLGLVNGLAQIRVSCACAFIQAEVMPGGVFPDEADALAAALARAAALCRRIEAECQEEAPCSP